MVGPEYEFLFVDVGMNGRNSDGGNWSQTRLKNGLEKNTLNLPDPAPLPGRNYPLPYVCTGDDAFPRTTYMMKPYPQENLSLEKRIFNYQLSRMKRISENTFGILVNCWRVLRKPFFLEPEKVKAITLALLTLYNWLRKESDLTKYIFHQQSIVNMQKLVKSLKGLGGKKSSQNHGSHYLTQELIILLTKQKLSGKNLQIILQMRVVFPGNGNALELIFKQ